MERTLRLDLFVPTPLWVLGKTLNYYCFFTAVIARQCYVAWHLWPTERTCMDLAGLNLLMDSATN